MTLMRIENFKAYMTQEEYDALPRERPRDVKRGDYWLQTSMFTGGGIELASGENYPKVPENNHLGYTTVVRSIEIEP